MANHAELPPYGNGTLPAGHPLAHDRRRERPDGAHAGGRLRDAGPAGGAAAAWLSGARLQLAQGDAAAGGGRLSRDRARPARLRPHHRLGRFLRRRPRSVPHAQHGARRGRARLRARLPAGGGDRRPRCRRAGRVLVRADPARHLPLGRDHELAVRRRACVAVQHREWRSSAALGADRRRTRRRAGEAHPPRKYYQNYQRTPGANDDMLHAPQGLHAFFRAYYHYKSADWKGQQTASAEGAHRRGDGEDPDLLRDGTRQGHGGETVAADMPSPAEIAAANG